MTTNYIKTVIIEASERTSIGETQNDEENGNYEVVLPKSIPINPNDRIEIANCFIDNKGITPDSITIEKDMEVETEQMMYLRNFSIMERTYAGKEGDFNNVAGAPNKSVTDSAPYVLCEFTPATHALPADSVMVRYSKIYIQRKVTPDWLSTGIPYPHWLCDNDYDPSRFAYLWYVPTPGAQPVSTTLFLSRYQTNGQQTQWASFDIDIVCVANAEFPQYFKDGVFAPVMGMTGIYFESPSSVISGVIGGFYDYGRVLYSTDPTYVALPPGVLPKYQFGGISFDTPTAVSEGILTPVRFSSTFTIPKNTYDPPRLAEIISTNMNRLQSTDSYYGSNRVEPTGPLTLHYKKSYSPTPTSSEEVCIALPNVLDANSNYSPYSTGWSVRRLQNNYGTLGTYTFRNETVEVDSVSYVDATTVKIALLSTFSTPTDYVTGGNVEYSFTLFREDGIYTGNKYLQLTEYYNQEYIPTNTADNASTFSAKYVFVNTSADRDILMFQGGSYWFGASAIKLEYEATKRRFQFPYLHSPITGSDSSFAVWALQAVKNNAATLAPFVPADDASEAFYVPSNAGIAFTKLLPAELWFNKLGFSPSIIPTVTRDGKFANIKH